MTGLTAIRGGRVIDPSHGIDEISDVWIHDGKILAVGKAPDLLSTQPATMHVDATGCVVTPGFLDLHVHLREPGQEGKETIASGTTAALAGGFTGVVCMANTVPVNDDPLVTSWILARARESGVPVRVYPVGAVTRGLQGKELAELHGMREAGAVALSDDGMPVMNAGLYRRAMEIAAALGIPVISHCEDHTLSAGGAMHEGEVSTAMGVPGVTWASEAVMVARDLVLARLTGARLHLAHLSSRESVALLREARARGTKVTAEVAPHHLTLIDADVRGYHTNAKMNPPLRERADAEALVDALADGTIDAIATDHAPHGAGDKDCEFGRAANGITGLETALPVVLSLVRAKRIGMTRAVELLTWGPARAFSLPGGTLKAGAPADVTVFDPAATWIYDRPVSKSKNSPWLGKEMIGRVREVFIGGERCIIPAPISALPRHATPSSRAQVPSKGKKPARKRARS